ncbi:MAG: hypothetical protein ACOX6V_03775 [Patescibacteria group bacterium]|jgi:hypothetical protein
MALHTFLLPIYFFISRIESKGITNPVLPNTDGTLEGVQNDPLAPLIARLWRTIVILGGLLVIIYLLWGALEWVTSGGDSNKVQSAQKKIVNAVIGLAILSASFAIVMFLGSVFGFNLLSIAWPTPAAE